MPGGVNSPVRAYSPYPFFTKCGYGSRLSDVDDKEYIDFCLAYGALILGHANPKVIEAVKVQLENGSLYGTPTEQEVDLAELICRVVPSAEMVRLVTTGAEATMSALRLARAYTGKKKIMKFEGCYHGAHDSVLVKAGSGATTFGMPDSLGIPDETARSTIVVPYNDTVKFEESIRANKKDLAAVIVEPVIGNIGLVLPEEGYLKTLREVTEEHGILLIFDEIITGFRLALGGAQEYYRVKPNLTTLGKILGGGFPMAAFCGEKEIMQMIAPSGKVYQAGTFSGNPVSVVAGLTTLKFLCEMANSIYGELTRKCEAVVDPVRALAQESDLDLQIVNISSMFQVFFSRTPVTDYDTAKTANNAIFMRYHAKLLERGIFLPPSQYETCFLSNKHSSEDLNKTVKCLVEVLTGTFE